MGALSPGMELITVLLEPIKGQISIGDSQKKATHSRGFRGIGRLAALTYCKRLVFTTSFMGESLGTQIIFDASTLAELLADDTQENVTIVDMLERIHTVAHFPKEGPLF